MKLLLEGLGLVLILTLTLGSTLTHFIMCLGGGLD
jgi:hypothetical protein